jgi:hypothetical protein
MYSAKTIDGATGKELSIMRELLYAMRFTGQATPVGTAGNVLTAATSAPSSSLTTTVTAAGLTTVLEAVDGDSAEFTSEVTFTSETSFQEIGTITFGSGTLLHFSTVGSGFLGPSTDPSRQHGAVMWRVERGEGQLTGATGLITSNFFVGQDLTVVDHHFGVLLID